jgi:hypothetical protein
MSAPLSAAPASVHRASRIGHHFLHLIDGRAQVVKPGWAATQLGDNFAARIDLPVVGHVMDPRSQHNATVPVTNAKCRRFIERNDRCIQRAKNVHGLSLVHAVRGAQLALLAQDKILRMIRLICRFGSWADCVLEQVDQPVLPPLHRRRV